MLHRQSLIFKDFRWRAAARRDMMRNMDETLIPDYQPVDRPLTLTKALGAARQVQFAVGALEAGHYDAAITLAGAAEDMLPGDPEIELTSKFMNSAGRERFGRKFWVQVIHLERDWLKHQTLHLADTMELSLDNAPICVYRAMRKLPLELITPEMLAFEKWYRGHVEDQKTARESAT